MAETGALLGVNRVRRGTGRGNATECVEIRVLPGSSRGLIWFAVRVRVLVIVLVRWLGVWVPCLVLGRGEVGGTASRPQTRQFSPHTGAARRHATQRGRAQGPDGGWTRCDGCNEHGLDVIVGSR
jgi:hypothetical protein